MCWLISDRLPEEDWKKAVGSVFKELGNVLSEDGSEPKGNDHSAVNLKKFSAEDLKELGAELQEIANAVGHGGKVDIANKLQDTTGEDSEYRFKITGLRIMKWANEVKKAVHG